VHLDTGNSGFMLLCTSLVMLMTPGLAFFYGGLVGRRSVLTIMMQSFVSMGWTTVVWSWWATRSALAAGRAASSVTSTWRSCAA
jgi:ammonia channel protein AmtB